MSIAEQAPVLIIILPLIASIASILICQWSGRFAYPLAVGTLVACVLLSVGIMRTVMESGPISYRLGGWAPPWGIELAIDHLNAFIAVIVSFMSLIVAVYSKRSIARELAGGKIPYFYATVLLLAAGLLGITVTGDLFNLFVFLEIASLAGYALIAVGDDRAPVASFNYVIMGTIGASLYLLGVGYLYIATGTLNIADLSRVLPDLYHSKVVLGAFVFFMVGVAIKIALFPLHIWLPAAYTHAPSAVSALAASTMTKVGVYVLIRILYTVFQPHFSIEMIPMSAILGWTAVAAMLAGSLLALAQTDLKRMLSYILIAEVGYIVMGATVGNGTGFIGAVLHILNDSFMMVCAFLAAGAIFYRTGTRNIHDLDGLSRRMPITTAAFTAAAISMVGIPPTAGFFSKWYLLLGALQARQWIFAAALIFSSLMIAIVYFRILERVYFKEAPASARVTREEVPLSMLVPMLVAAAGVLTLGLFSGKIIASVIQFTVPRAF